MTYAQPRPCKRHPPDPPPTNTNSFDPINHMLGKMLPLVQWKNSGDVHPGHSFPPKRYSLYLIFKICIILNDK